jgi:hypothetical protein
MLPKIVSLISIVVLLAWMFYCICGGLPLLILKYDVPLDSRFVRGFVNVHYQALMAIASVGALASAFSDRQWLTATFGGIALVGFIAHRLIVSRMDRLRSTMSAADAPAIRRFRRLHITAMVLNVCLLTGFVTVLIASSADMVSCVEVAPGPGCRGDGCHVQCSLL